LRGEELELEGGREEGLMKTPDLEGSRFFHRRRLCYEPNDRYCPEQFPLRCGWRRDSHEMGDERDGGLMDGKL
jgi:hypothetical protein